MELDDLKKQWKLTTTTSSPDEIKLAIEKKISNAESSGRRIQKTFWIEMILSWTIYFVFWAVMLIYRPLIPPYMFKIVTLIGVAMIPIVWRLYKSMHWAISLDYSRDVRSNVVAFVRYYKNTLMMYEWGCYVVILIALALLYTDQSFLSAHNRIRYSVLIYLVIVVLITRPYVYLVYGKKVAVFEDFLKD